MPQDQDDIKGADAMKQAPTPGPLSGDDEQVAHLAKTLDKSPDEIRRALANLQSKGLVRLAPTAPVEASGSVGRRDGCLTDVERSAYAEGLSDAAQRARYLAKHQEWEEEDGPNSRRDGFEFACEVLSDLLEEASSGALKDALLPQPSGETRSVWTYCPECGSDEVGHEEGDHKQCGGCGQEWFSDIDYSDVVQKNLARLFARPAPVASGGQHSSGEVGLAANEIGAHIAKRDAEYEAALADLTIKPDASSLDEFSRSIFGALSDCPAMSLDKQADFVARALWPVVSTTPARAKAPNEGAAGEREQTDCKRCAGNGEIVTDWDRYLGAPQPGDQGDEGTADCPDCDGIGKVDASPRDAIKLLRLVIDEVVDQGDRVYFGSTNHVDWLRAMVEKIEREAHPSPPPAADEDRVRSALADLVTWFDKPVQGERGMVWVIRAGDQGADDAVAEALAALKSTAAKEGEK